MRVLVTGATGFIGAALVGELQAGGCDVVCASRHASARANDETRCDPLAVDFARVPASGWWAPRLAGIDAVVNAVGILREQRGQSFAALHTDAPVQLFNACRDAGVPFVIQVSALGADAQASSDYHRSKREADDVLRALGIRCAIVQPSLVYGPGGPSAQLFDLLASLPVLGLPAGGTMQVQPVLVDDVVAGIVALLRSPPATSTTIAFVGPQPMSFREYLARLRKALGWRAGAIAMPVPAGVFLAAAGIASRLPGSFLDRQTASMLLRGNAAPAGPFAALLGRQPKAVEEFVAAREADAARQGAVLSFMLPVLRLSIALLWIWTGVVSLGLYPVADSLELLGRVGLHGAIAAIALYGAAALDFALGVLTLAAPASWRPLVWAVQLLLVAGYTVLISLFLPQFWLHPYGPISKNLPVMAAIALLWLLEPRRAKRA